MAVELGSTLSHFRLEERIGAGAMDVVYWARDEITVVGFYSNSNNSTSKTSMPGTRPCSP